MGKGVGRHGKTVEGDPSRHSRQSGAEVEIGVGRKRKAIQANLTLQKSTTAGL